MSIKEFLRMFILYGGYISNKNRKSKLLYYHDVYDDMLFTRAYTSLATPLSLFKEHMAIVKQEKFTVSTVINTDNDQVQIAFDDGFKGIWDNRFYFYENKIFPTIFISNALIGNMGYLSLDNILELKENGFRFQSHSYSHINLSMLSCDDLMMQLLESKLQLENMLKESVDEICFPMGYFSDLVYNLSLDVGYTKLFSSIPGSYNKHWKDNLYYRNFVQSLSPLQFKYVLLGGMDILQKHYMAIHFKK